MIASAPFDSMVSFALSGYGLAVLAVAVLLACMLWSDQLKKFYYDSEEKKKWRHWNHPKPDREPHLKSRDNPHK
jgi:hypothetical protein